METQGKVAIVTGASGGIGLATARLFAQHGAKVALVARSTDKLNALAAELPASLPVTADMQDVEAIRRMVEAVHRHYSRIDILVNNAGRAMVAPMEHTDLGHYRELLALNVLGPLVAMQAVIPIMREQGGGVIVNISSGVTKTYLPNLSAYSTTKYALNAISLIARAELAPDNIRVSVVYPYITATDFERNTIGAQPEFSQGLAGIPEPESAEQAAEKILEAVRTEAAEVVSDTIVQMSQRV